MVIPHAPDTRGLSTGDTMNKKLAAIAVAASMATGAGAGVALFGPSAATATTAAAASTAAAPNTAPPTAPPWMTDALKKLVDAGTITQAQADAVSAAILAAQPPHGPGGPGGPGRPGGRHELGDDLAIAAKAIGIDTNDLRSALAAGRSMADVAKAHGVDPQKVIDALVADEKAELADQVSKGALTQAQADQMSGSITQRVTDRVNGVRPPHPDGPGEPGGPPPESSPAPSSSPSTTTAA